MQDVFFSYDGDKFKVTPCGEWVCMWTGENWHVNPIGAWCPEVQNKAKQALNKK